MTRPDIRLAGVFIQTERGVIVRPVIMDFRRRAHRKSHSAAAGRPHFWIKWYSFSEAMRRLRHECTPDVPSREECIRCRLVGARFAAEIE